MWWCISNDSNADPTDALRSREILRTGPGYRESAEKASDALQLP